MRMKLYNKLPKSLKQFTQHTTFLKETKIIVITTDLLFTTGVCPVKLEREKYISI
jgi:hypothetical protein